MQLYPTLVVKSIDTALAIADNLKVPAESELEGAGALLHVALV